ncbi:MAG: hypothetical protein Kow0010_00600 [Dehalococcoidia bacterium]
MTLSGIVLAGGKSRRFGSDKASADLLGKPLLQWVVSALEGPCDEVVVVRARNQPLPAVGASIPIRMADDLYDGLGPLAGLVAGLAVATGDFCFAVSTDVPLLRPALVELLARRARAADAVCPDVEGFMQPLVAVYRRGACLPAFRRAVEAGQLKITAAYAGLRVDVVNEEDVRTADPDLWSFRNANTPAALGEIAALIESRRLVP